MLSLNEAFKIVEQQMKAHPSLYSETNPFKLAVSIAAGKPVNKVTDEEIETCKVVTYAQRYGG